MRIFNLVLLVLFGIESLAKHIPEHNDLRVEKKIIKNVLFKKWAVLVAGSNGWDNYRHQADVYHAYQILRENGIPKENIITMAADDIAFHPKNPTPGKIINRPNGTNIYDGVIIDYKGNDVNSSNFINIITGNEKAMQSIGSGKVIKGGPLDKIFIFYSDHGAVGALFFQDDILFADQLNDALKIMHSKRIYGKMLLYIEACFSGSLFDGILRDDTNVLAVTAAGPREMSWATYCNTEGELYETCLGDLFSVSWMEHAKESVSESIAKKRTVFNNFNRVRTNVFSSNVMIYGDFDIGHEKLSTFIGDRPRGRNASTKSIFPLIKHKNLMQSCGVTKHHSLKINMTQLQRQQLEEETDKVKNVIDKVLRNIYLEILKSRPNIEDETGTFDEPAPLALSLDMFPCYRNIVTKISKSCFSVPKNSYVMNRLSFFANLCVVDQNIDGTVNNIISNACSTIQKDIENVH